MSLDYINSHYGLSIRLGQRVEYSGGKTPRIGTVTGADGAHVLIKLDGEYISFPYHPTWRLRFIAPGRPEVVPGPPDGPGIPPQPVA